MIKNDQMHINFHVTQAHKGMHKSNLWIGQQKAPKAQGLDRAVHDESLFMLIRR